MTTNDDRWNESNPRLVTIIRDEIERNGPIRFDRFMDLVLYHPEHGYYRSSDPAPGRAGDFLTAPEAHPIFGATLAAQIVRFDDLLNCPERFTIVEYGAGSGRLIRPLLAELRQNHADLYQRVRYVPVELNQARLTELRQHLEHGGHADLIAPELSGSSVTGCVIANEFLDAFPVRRITMERGGLREVFVSWQDGWLHEEIRAIDDPPIQSWLKRHELVLTEGDWIEINDGIEPWITDVAHILEHGFALVIDYGYPAAELFQDHRRNGTLKAYFQHGASTEFYRGIGKQDLTAHVNFSEVIHHATAQGLQTHDLTTQSDLLAALGIGNRLMRLQENPDLTADDYLGVRAAVIRMIDPGAMGRFRVLILSKGTRPALDPTE